MSKTHYRKVFKSDHLGSADLEEFLEEGKDLVFTIKEVKQELGTKVAGRKIDANVAYFKENIKPMVLNATNSKIVKSFNKTKDHPKGSPFVEDWKDTVIELYIDASVKMKGEIVGGVRIKENPPEILDEQQIKLAKGKIAACLSIEQLTTLYNSDIKYKTNKDLVEAFREKNRELKENS